MPQPKKDSESEEQPGRTRVKVHLVLTGRPTRNNCIYTEEAVARCDEISVPVHQMDGRLVRKEPEE